MSNYPPKSHTKALGYTWKLCCYSNKYKEEYYDNALPGPSNHSDLYNNPGWVALNTTEHTLTSGTMNYKNSGWICWDPNCYYYTTVNSGIYFFES